MSSNPMMRTEVYNDAIPSGGIMTISGTVNKTLGLLAVATLVACYTWYLAFAGFVDKLNILMWVGVIGGFILGLITSFKPQQAKPLGIAYAACEGLFLGGISAYFNSIYPGIVVQAALITIVTMFVMLGLFKANIIQATAKFRAVITCATISIAVFYLLAIVLSIFHVNSLLNIINSASDIGIVLTVIVALVASFNFILDFDFIERGTQMGAPKYLEWYGAFALLVTLIWLYIEVLRLLAKINSRRN